ncbi:MAG TPA: T9SS type A sorting domain-containing protein [Chitinophagales bacterium]|nr:T9SS type A sorting domain-containing protein [Chitinophagales bacterium]
MKKLLIVITALLPLAGFSQIYNKGGVMYIQKGAILNVQGDFVNDNGTTGGSVKNDGIIELTGDFNNVGSASFTVNTDNTSKDRAVKFVGSGTQAIKGNMNTSGTASFYNLIVDKTNSTDAVEMQASVTVDGSLVFGNTTTTNTYNPSVIGTNNNQKGLLKTYDASGEYLLSIANGNTDAIAGYADMAMNEAPTTAYVVTSGDRGTANGGLQRMVASATAYDYPVGTAEHGFNAIRMNFTGIPVGGGMVKGKFEDGTDNANGSVGNITSQCIGCTTQYSEASNSGYNRYFVSNPCNNGAPQWLSLESGAVTNHGYWSFASADNNQNYNYWVEAFPNNYTMSGNNNDIWRTLQYIGAYENNPSGADVSWNANIDNVEATTDLLQYSRNTGSCYAGMGVPGGTYSGFGQMALFKSNNGSALPVRFLYVTAAVTGHDIQVNWATAVEINNNGFKVERSTDGIGFSQIGWVSGHNNSTSEQDYSYTDNTVAANTMYYYRLTQVDNNGQTMESNIVNAKIDAAATAAITVSEVMPNPATVDSRIVVNSGVAQNAVVNVYNMVGQVVATSPYILNAGDNTVDLNVQLLANGNYNAVIEAGGKSISKLFVVSH